MGQYFLSPAIVLFLLTNLLSPSTDSFAEQIIGGQSVYHVLKGDTLEIIGAKFGKDWRLIAKENGLDARKILKIGTELRINTRRIAPVKREEGIVINIPERMLYFFKGGKLEMAFPVGLGMSLSKGSTRWRTPVGTFTVLEKEKNPTWNVPESIQEEMEMEGKEVLISLPPGPDNPLGRYALRLSIPGILIHETIWPNTVYQFRSHGCIRVSPEHMEKFYEKVDINSAGEIIYKWVKIAVSEDGKIYLEVHPDAYRKSKDTGLETRKLIEEAGLSGKVNWDKVERLLKEKTGIATDVTL